MADANLMDALSKKGKGESLNDIVLFGRVRCAIKRPYVVGKNLETLPGFFAIIDCYALKCLGEDYFSQNGVWDFNKVYFTKGSMLIYLDEKKWIGKDVKVYSTSVKRGVKIRQQWAKKSSYDGITAFAFARQGNGFAITPNKVLELGESDPDARGTALEDFIISIVKDKNGVIEYPVTLDSVVAYEGTLEYEELNDSEVKDAFEFVESEEKIDITKIDLNLVYHLDSPPISDLYDDVKSEIADMSRRRSRYAKDLVYFLCDMYKLEMKDDVDYSELGLNTAENILSLPEVSSNIRTRFITNVASKYDEIVGLSKVRGKEFVKNLIDIINKPELITDDIKVDIPQERINKYIEELATTVKIDPYCLFGSTNTEIDNIPVLQSNLHFAIAVISVTTGIGIESLMGNFRYCERAYSVDLNLWFYSLIRYPYSLGMLSTGLSIVDCDVIYHSFSAYYGKGILKEENLDMRKNIIFLETLSNASDKDTFVKEYALKSKKSDYPALATRYLNQNQFPARQDIVEVLKLLLSKAIVLSKPYIAKLVNLEWYTDEKKSQLIEYGVLNMVDDYLILESDLEKEFMIYDVFIKKGKQETNITDDQISSIIEEFEESRGFKLEALQREGIKLCKYQAGVLSGCAGSGKTTTSDCMTEVLKQLNGYEIIYCTPTGKACRRLAEVVGGVVRTLHSQFGIGMGGEAYLSNVKKKFSSDSSKKIYLLDEMAMASMPLVYQVARNLNDGDLCYLLGDIKQLPPIGKGVPFKILMKLLPCVELGVSKRAAEGSNVNYNTTLVNCMSDGIVRELTYDDSTFICKECSDVDIPLVSAKVWEGLMSGSLTGTSFKEEDIQVITGYQKEEISFSAPRVNPSIQRLLRSKDRLLYKYIEKDFYQNDRVIHLKRNAYEMCRYIEVAPNTFECQLSFGVVNGEMGKLLGVVRSDMCHFLPYNENAPLYKDMDKDSLELLLKAREERDGNFRDDSKLNDEKHFFVKVQVYDVDLKRDVIVLYRATGSTQDGSYLLRGEDLGYLDLAYALTTHKMQGSQSEAVILLFGSSCNPNFINRNMLNTMITRSQGTVVMIGTIKGMSSPVTRARQHVSKVECNDMLSLLTE